MADVFDKLAEELNLLGQEVQEIYEKCTVQEIRVAGSTLKKNLIRGAGKNTEISTALVSRLNQNITEKEYFVKGRYYIVNIDWDTNKIVNTDLGMGYGKYADVERSRKKRNYSIRPATYYDLAYIINYGRGVNFSGKNDKIIAGNYFIQKAVRRISKWRDKRDLLVKTKLQVLAIEKFER